MQAKYTAKCAHHTPSHCGNIYLSPSPLVPGAPVSRTASLSEKLPSPGATGLVASPPTCRIPRGHRFPRQPAVPLPAAAKRPARPLRLRSRQGVLLLHLGRLPGLELLAGCVGLSLRIPSGPWPSCPTSRSSASSISWRTSRVSQARTWDDEESRSLWWEVGPPLCPSVPLTFPSTGDQTVSLLSPL